MLGCVKRALHKSGNAYIVINRYFRLENKQDTTLTVSNARNRRNSNRNNEFSERKKVTTVNPFRLRRTSPSESRFPSRLYDNTRLSDPFNYAYLRNSLEAPSPTLQ